MAPIGTDVRESLVVMMTPEIPQPVLRILPPEWMETLRLGDPRNSANGRMGNF